MALGRALAFLTMRESLCGILLASNEFGTEALLHVEIVSLGGALESACTTAAAIFRQLTVLNLFHCRLTADRAARRLCDRRRRR